MRSGSRSLRTCADAVRLSELDEALNMYVIAPPQVGYFTW